MRKLINVLAVSILIMATSIATADDDERLERIEDTLSRIETLLTAQSEEERNLMDLYARVLDMELEMLENGLNSEKTTSTPVPPQDPPNTNHSATRTIYIR